jgi:tryptophan synthase alpha chain
MADRTTSDPVAPGREGEEATGGGSIAAAFAAAREQGRAALMPYMMGGFPDQATSIAVADAYADAGADLVELGIPYSDPLADGPVIHAAATRALASGAGLDSVLAICERLAARVPVIAMGYANMALARGPQRFARALADAGACGAIVADLPPEEGGEVAEELRAAGLALVPLVAPTTPAPRRARICAAAEGFVYLVSDTRTTGERDELPAALAGLVAATRADSPVPVAVGFGIGTPEQAAEVGEVADGVIIGSRLVRAVAEAADQAAAAEAVSSFVRACRERMSAGRV